MSKKNYIEEKRPVWKKVLMGDTWNDAFSPHIWRWNGQLYPFSHKLHTHTNTYTSVPLTDTNTCTYIVCGGLLQTLNIEYTMKYNYTHYLLLLHVHPLPIALPELSQYAHLPYVCIEYSLIIQAWLCTHRGLAELHTGYNVRGGTHVFWKLTWLFTNCSTVHVMSSREFRRYPLCRNPCNITCSYI